MQVTGALPIHLCHPERSEGSQPLLPVRCDSIGLPAAGHRLGLKSAQGVRRLSRAFLTGRGK